MDRNEFLYSSVFGKLTEHTQIRFDKTSEMRKKLFDNVVLEDYLDWDVPTIGLNFEELIGQYNISVAAPTIGENAKEPIMRSNGVETLKEAVLRHAITRSMPMQDYRKILEIQDSKSLSDDAKKTQLIKMMFGDVQTVVGSVYAKLDILFLKALSNEGVCDIDASINPEGGVRGRISFNAPVENGIGVERQWTEDNKETVDCFEDIQKVMEKSANNVALSKVLIAPSKLYYMCRTKKVKQLIWGNDKAGRMVGLRDLNAYMQENSYPVFEPIRRTTTIQNGATTEPCNPFNDKNLVFVPDGKLGVIKNAWANSELKPEQGIAYSNYGRIRVSQWGVGESQGSNSVEYTKAEVMALPVITEMNAIYTLKTEV